MAGQYINAIFRHAPMSESQIAAKLNRDRESVLVNDFVPSSVGYSGTDLEKSRYIMSVEYEHGDEVVRRRRNLTTIELLKSGAAHPNAGASNVYIDAEKTDYKTLSNTARGLSIQEAVNQLDNSMIIKDGADDDSKGNSIGLGSINCAIINGSNNTIDTLKTNSVILNGDENFVDNNNEVTSGAKVVDTGKTGYNTDAHTQSSTLILTGTTESATTQELLLNHSDDRIKIPLEHINGDLLYSSVGGMITLTGVLYDSTGNKVAAETNLYTFSGVQYNNTNYDPTDGSPDTLTAINTTSSDVNSGSINVGAFTFGINSSNELIFQITTSSTERITWIATIQMNKTSVDAP